MHLGIAEKRWSGNISLFTEKTRGPDSTVSLEKIRAGRFRKHHRPCGQPAVDGGIESFLPVPAHAGHLTRIKAMPSDLPLTSTDRAMYPLPPQRGQLFGSTPPPQLLKVFHQIGRSDRQTSFCYEMRTKCRSLRERIHCLSGRDALPDAAVAISNPYFANSPISTPKGGRATELF
jgi:hypothetical protein